MDLYIDFMTVYCKHEKPNYEEFADVYTGRIMAYMNDPNPDIVKSVIAAMTSIFGKLPKESQFVLVPVIRN
jgi:hypothetical protein